MRCTRAAQWDGYIFVKRYAICLERDARPVAQSMPSSSDGHSGCRHPCYDGNGLRRGATQNWGRHCTCSS